MYKQVDLDHYFNPDHLGPSIGTKQGCAACHGNVEKGRRALNNLIDPDSIFSMMNHQFLMPLDSRTGETKAYFDAMKKIQELNPGQQQRVVEIFNEVKPVRQWGQTAETHMAQQKALMYLRDLNKITQAELDAAIGVVNNLDGKTNTMFGKMMDQHRQDLRLWLAGGSRDCVIKSPSIDPTTSSEIAR